jgi:hypothetical protein
MLLAECSEDHRSDSDDRSSDSSVSAKDPSDAVSGEGRLRSVGALAARRVAADNLDEEMEDVEVLLIDEGQVNVDAGSGLTLAEAEEPLVVEDVMEDHKDDMPEQESDDRSIVDTIGRAISVAAPPSRGSPELDTTRISPTGSATVGARASRREAPPDSSQPPSMELWDCLLTQMMSSTTAHGEAAANVRGENSGVGSVVLTPRNGTLMEVTLAGDCSSETSSSSSEASSPQSRECPLP